MRVAGDLPEARRVLDHVERALALVVIEDEPAAIVHSQEHAFYAIDAAYGGLKDDGRLSWALVYLGPQMSCYAVQSMPKAIWLAIAENEQAFDLYVDAFGAEADA
jgi:hypothetical protein